MLLFDILHVPRYMYCYPLGLQEVETPRNARQSSREGGKVVSPTHRPPFPPLVPISVRGCVYPRATVRSEGLSQQKHTDDPFGNRSSIVTQPTAPRRTHIYGQ
jgi:hypothetical protein